jgi:hypothetical protein
MHLRGFPRYYVKDGDRRAVYYTADARDLRAQGWLPEEKPVADTKSEPAKPVAAGKGLGSRIHEHFAIEPLGEPEPQTEVAEEPQEGTLEPLPPIFESLTKPELIHYAFKRGVKLQPALSKAELIEACKKL